MSETKLVIDISEKVYEDFMNDWVGSPKILSAVRRGVPLPKGHGRLIDADMLEKKVEKHRKVLKISEYDRDLVLHYTDIEMAPTIIERDRGEEDAVSN